MDESVLDLLLYLKWGFFAFQFLLFAVIIAVHRLDGIRESIGNKAILIVTAHPDDESMFFIPTIVNLAGANNLHLLSLSTGNADGLGKIREDELLKVGTLLRFKTVHCIDDPSLPDGMNTTWDPSLISSHLDHYITSYNIGVVITFDSAGVSNHRNHCAVRAGVQRYMETGTRTVKCYELLSTGFIRKYIGVLDVFAALNTEWLFVNVSPFLTWRAMQTHRSQFVWYRKLFVLFSRYAYINTLQPISINKDQL